MSKPRLKLVAVFDTLGHAQTVQAGLAAALVGTNRFDTQLEIYQNEANQPELVLHVRFNTLSDREAVRTYITTNIQNNALVHSWIQRGWIAWHLCTHDEASVVDCRHQTDVTQFQEAAL